MIKDFFSGLVSGFSDTASMLKELSLDFPRVIGFILGYLAVIATISLLIVIVSKIVGGLPL